MTQVLYLLKKQLSVVAKTNMQGKLQLYYLGYLAISFSSHSRFFLSASVSSHKTSFLIKEKVNNYGKQMTFDSFV